MITSVELDQGNVFIRQEGLSGLTYMGHRTDRATWRSILQLDKSAAATVRVLRMS